MDFPAPARVAVSCVHASSDAATAQVFAAANLFLFPSLFEGTPLTLIEAMASGLPIVTSATCGMKDAIEDGRTGLLVPTRSPDAIVRAVIAVVAERSSAGFAAGMAAQEEALRHYTWKQTAVRSDRLRTDRPGQVTHSPWIRFLNPGCAPRTTAGTTGFPWTPAIRPGTCLFVNILDADRDLSGKTVLEIGCGRGGFACWLASHPSRPSKVVAVDFSRSAVGKAAEFAGWTAASALWEVGDIIDADAGSEPNASPGLPTAGIVELLDRRVERIEVDVQDRRPARRRRRLAAGRRLRTAPGRRGRAELPPVGPTHLVDVFTPIARPPTLGRAIR